MIKIQSTPRQAWRGRPSSVTNQVAPGRSRACVFKKGSTNPALFAQVKAKNNLASVLQGSNAISPAGPPHIIIVSSAHHWPVV